MPVSSDFIDWIANGEILFLPVPVAILAIAFVGFYLFVERTPLGVQIRATGGNLDAAIQSGIAVRRNVILTYMLGSLAVARSRPSSSSAASRAASAASAR